MFSLFSDGDLNPRDAALLRTIDAGLIAGDLSRRGQSVKVVAVRRTLTAARW
jgi:hypothetical protein